MTIIMLLEDDQDKAGALVEAAIDLSRVTNAEICCLDVAASACGTPIALSLGGSTHQPPARDGDICRLCFGRKLGESRPTLEQATFIVSRSARALKRAVAQGYGPVMLIPEGHQRLHLNGTAVILLDDSPSIARNAAQLRPILQAATRIEIVTMRGAAPSDAERLIGDVFGPIGAGGPVPPVHIIMARDIDVRSECVRLGADWCVAGTARADGGGPRPALMKLLDAPPAPVLLCS